jgi:hypothetical protein
LPCPVSILQVNGSYSLLLLIRLNNVMSVYMINGVM